MIVKDALKNRMKPPPVPTEAQSTARREIVSLLANEPQSAKELSARIGISEKEVYAHLEHVKRSLGQSGRRFAVIPPECKKCGFVFSKRDRVKKPGKCPVCKGEAIQEPLFIIRETE